MTFPDASLTGAFASAVFVLVGLVLRDAGRFLGRAPFMLPWSASCILAAAAAAVFALRGRVPDAAVILGANSLYILSTAMVWAGARRLHGRQAHPGLVALPVAVWATACAVPAFYGSLAARVVLVSLLTAALNAATAATLWRPAPDRGTARAQLWLAAGSGALAALHLLRAAGFASGLLEAPLLQPLFLASSLIFVAIGYVGLTATYTLAVERATQQYAEVEGRTALMRAEAADREAAALRAGQREVQRLHSGLPAMISLWDVAPDGRAQLRYRGGDALGVTGWPMAELNRLGCYDHLAEPGRHPLEQGLREAMAEGTSTIEWRLRQPDGSWRWMRCLFHQLARHPDGGGQVVAHAIDINAEREAATRAEAMRAELDYTLAHAPIAIFRAVLRTDDRWVRTLVSRGIEVLSGWPASEMARPGAISERMGPEWQAQYAEIVAALRQRGQHQVEARMRHAAGHWIWVRFKGNVTERLADGSLALVGYTRTSRASARPRRERRWPGALRHLVRWPLALRMS